MKLTRDQAFAQSMKHIDNREHVQADRLLTAILNKFPGDENARLALVKLALRLDLRNKALEILKAGLRSQPKSQSFWLQTTKILLDKSKLVGNPKQSSSLISDKKIEILRNYLILDQKHFDSEVVKNYIEEEFKFFDEQTITRLTRGLNKTDATQVIENLLKTGDEPVVQAKYAELMLLQKKPFHALKFSEMALLNGHYSKRLLEILSNSLLAVDAYDACLYSVNYALKHHGSSLWLKFAEGSAFLELQEFEKAFEALKEALSFDKKNTLINNKIGLVARKLDRYEDALFHFKEVEKNNVSNINIYNNLGSIFLDLGEIDKAQNYFSKAVNFNIRDGSAHRHLSMTRKYKKNDPHLQQMQQVMKNDLAKIDKSQLSFAMAKYFHDTEDYKGAIAHYQTGNQLLKEIQQYSILRDEMLFQKIRKSYEGLEQFSFNLSNSQRKEFGKISPIFIVGLPRSGTTLLEQIISSDPDIYGAGELEFLGNAVRKSNILTNNMLDANAFLSIFDAYSSDSKTLNAHVFTDKLPLNFRWLGLIHKLFPDAKILHIHRDPVATCWSIYTQFFASQGNAYGNNLLDLVKYYQLYIDLMDFWQNKFSEKIHHVSYENLTENPREVAEGVFQFLQRTFRNEYIDNANSARAVRTASAQQVKKTIYKNSSHNWKRYSEFLGEFPENLIAIKSKSFLKH